jgi:hypothetical protein
MCKMLTVYIGLYTQHIWTVYVQDAYGLHSLRTQHTMLLTVHVAYTHSIHELYMHMLPLTVYLAHTYSIHEQYMHLLPLTVYIAWHKMYTWNAYAHDAHGLHSLYIKCTWTVYAHATCSSYSLYKQYTTYTQHTWTAHRHENQRMCLVRTCYENLHAQCSYEWLIVHVHVWHAAQALPSRQVSKLCGTSCP